MLIEGHGLFLKFDLEYWDELVSKLIFEITLRFINELVHLAENIIDHIIAKTQHSEVLALAFLAKRIWFIHAF